MDFTKETIKSKDTLIDLLRFRLNRVENENLEHKLNIEGLEEINQMFNKMVSDIVNRSGLKIICCAGADVQHDSIDGVSHTAGEIISAINSLKSQLFELLSLIYSSAEGEVCMGYKSDIESIARHAYSITGVSSSQLMNLTNKVCE